MTALRPTFPEPTRRPSLRAGIPHGPARWTALALVAQLAALPLPSPAADPTAPPPLAGTSAVAKKPASGSSAAHSVGEQLRQAVQTGTLSNKRLTLTINGKEKKYITLPASEQAGLAGTAVRARDAASEPQSPASAGRAEAIRPLPSAPVFNPKDRPRRIRAATQTPAERGSAAGAGHGFGAEATWAYEGPNGPQAWGRLRPDYQLCANGQRQSPINIDESSALQGPAEALQFSYQPSSGSVVNNGHTVQVDLLGDNALTVRGSSYKLVQLHFHHPAEERIDGRTFAMVAHLVHQNEGGQLAVLAVLLEPGPANPVINQVWTYMPLDAGDRVQVPAGRLELNGLLPPDQRYYQFMGSLTTPPCTEGVLWLVLKQPVTVSPAQIRLFSQLFPNNARPVQPPHGRVVRSAQ